MLKVNKASIKLEALGTSIGVHLLMRNSEVHYRTLRTTIASIEVKETFFFVYALGNKMYRFSTFSFFFLYSRLN